jgi:hypothetical protein
MARYDPLESQSKSRFILTGHSDGDDDEKIDV